MCDVHLTTYIADYICFRQVSETFQPLGFFFLQFVMLAGRVPQGRLTRKALSHKSVVPWLGPRPASNKDDSDSEAKPSMGQLALYLLALRANCEFIGGRKGDRLVSQLKRFLEDEKRAIGEEARAARGGEGASDSIMERAHQSFGFSPQASFLPSALPVLIFIEAWACSRGHP